MRSELSKFLSEGWNSIALIDLEAIKLNLRFLKNRAGANTMQMAVVKANAYGHGAALVSIGVQDDVDWFGVSSVREGLELREQGIMKPIMVFGSPYSDSAQFYTDFGLTAVVSHIDHFDILKPGTKYHIKFDTGMGRIGFRPEQLNEVVSAIQKRNDIRFEGVMTHFATAEHNPSTIFDEQMEKFLRIKKEFSSDVLFHVANSGATIHHEDVGFDLIRSGIAMYGFDPVGSVNPNLKPSMEWISRISQVRFLNKGDGVSYSHSFVMPADGYVGVIPIGYADGLLRKLANRVSVRCNNHEFKQIGNVTMDQIMVHLGLQPPEKDTEVLIMGGTGNQSVYHWAGLLETIPYELTSAIGVRVKRVVRNHH
jgi:alanine racemase